MEMMKVEGRKRFKPYRAYKDSGVEWLGEIPAHWEVKRLKHLAALNPESLSEETDPTLEMVYVDIGGVDNLGRIIEQEQLTFASAPSRARRLVRDGDVIVSTVRTYLRAIAPISEPEPGTVVSTGFAVVRPEDELTTDYAAYALRAPYFVERVVANSRGVSFPAINESEMATYELAAPPEPEQRAIGAFLDRETARIDALVAKKGRLIELLQEKRTALISQAVTKGLDPNVPMKDSGVEWLDQYPAHWTGLPLKRWVATKITDGPHETPELVTEGVDFISAEAVSNGRIDFDKRRGFISPDLHTYYCRKCKPIRDDILICKSGATTGKLARLNVDVEFSVWSPLALVRANRSRILPGFLEMALGAEYVQKQIKRTWSAGTQPNISMGDLEQLFVVAPQMEEQARILDFVERSVGGFDLVGARVRNAIDRLKELRTALISAAVTGKIDIREEVA
jgi:type I restriction enzyme S subunit